MYEQQPEENNQEKIAIALQGFASKLSRLATEQVALKQETEDRWLEDLRQYHGRYPDSENQILQANKDGAKVFVNITRNKTNAAEARLQDMLFPTDDRNWGIQPTPVPEQAQQNQLAKAQNPFAPQMQQQPQALSQEDANDRAQLMQEEIDDQLKESRYQIKSRDVIHDACLLGSGIIKGPVVVGKTKKKWSTLPDGMSVLQITETLSPETNWVDPWNFYPDMSASRVDDAEFFFERHKFTKKQLRDFAKLPGVIVEQVKQLYKEGATGTNNLATDRTNDIRQITGVSTIDTKDRFEIWEYHGPISKSELIAALMSGTEFEMEEIDDLNDEVDAVVFFSGSHILKVAINPMDTEERPYSVFNWEQDDSNIFGFGVPYLMRNPQKVINAAWRMMLDNAGQAVADQIIVDINAVRPADGDWNTRKRKVWYKEDSTKSVHECMAAFETRNHQLEYANIYQMARQLCDEETNLPLIAQGEQGQHVTKTAQGMSMLMNSANIVLRRAVKNWDDDITRPLITRFYDWNMQFNPKEEIKGDYTIDARGSSALLVREKQQENLMIFANISGSNPELAKRRDWEGMDREIAKSLEVNYDNITLSDDKIKQIESQMQDQQAPVDPMMEIRGQELQLKAQAAEIKAEQDAIDSERRFAIEQQKLIDNKELQILKLQYSDEAKDRELAQKMQIELQKDKTKRDSVAATISQRQTEINLKAQNLAQGHDTYG